MNEATLTFFRDRKKEWRWRLKAPNGRIVATSGEGYKRIAGAVKGFNAAIATFQSPVAVVLPKKEK